MRRRKLEVAVCYVFEAARAIACDARYEKQMSPFQLSFIIFMFAAACGGKSPAPEAAPATPDPAKTEPAKIEPVTSCPKVTSIDCMPEVKPENARYCNPENRKWIEANCSSITFSD